MTDPTLDQAVEQLAEEPPRPNTRKAILAFVAAIVVGVIVFGVIFPQIVDWNDVFDVLREVELADLVLITTLALVRYVPAGWIYSLVLPGLSLKRGTQAWVATTGVASTLPGFDLVLRLAMYRGWGFTIERTMSGMFLSGLVEMSTKLLVATLAVTIWGMVTLDAGILGIAAVCIAVLGLIGWVVRTILKSEDHARRVATRIQAIVLWVFTKFERQAPDDLVERVVDVRLEARSTLGTRWPQAFLAAFIGQGLVYSILLLSIRAVGIDNSVLSWTELLFGYAIAVIVTSIPITPGSVGVAELVLVGCFTAFAGREYGDAITAGVILYRLAIWLLPIPIGWGITLRWQARTGSRIFGNGPPSPAGDYMPDDSAR